MRILKAFLMQPKKYLTCSIVGSPTIDGTIVTDISTSDYIRYATADILSGHNWEICLKVWWNGTTNNAVYLRVADSASYLRIETNGGYSWLGYDTNNSSWWVHNTNFLRSGGWYYLKLKFEFKTGTFRIYYGKNPNNMTLSRSVSKNTQIQLRYLTSTRYIYSNANAGNGKIDVGCSYIKVENTKYNLRLP